MRVLVSAASFASNISGIQRHALNAIRCLLLRPEISDLHLVLAPWQCSMVQAAGLPHDYRLQIHIAGMNRSSLSRNRWYYRELPRLASQLRVDLVHFSYPMPLSAAAFPCPTVVTLHDLYPYEIPRNFGFPKFLFNRLVLRQCLHNAHAIACVSEATLLRLKQYAQAAVWRKATRIYNCVEPEPQSAQESPIHGWKGEPFLLCVAQHRWNKNILVLIDAFERLLRFGWIEPATKLVVIGIRGPESSRIFQYVANSGLSQSVRFLEGLTEPELQWCYQNCEVLIAPSITEGFGLPVAEGLLAGCRIVCSDIPAHREIGEEYCRFVMLRQNAADALAAVIADTLNDPKRYPVALPQLSAPVLADQYIDLYRKLTTSSEPARSTKISNPNFRAASDPILIPVADRESALACRGK